MFIREERFVGDLPCYEIAYAVIIFIINSRERLLGYSLFIDAYMLM